MNKKTILKIALPIIAVIIIAGVIYWRLNSNKIYIEKATITAPTISLAPKTSGTLNNVFANDGEEVGANQIIAQVGNELVKSKIAGLILSIRRDKGALISPTVPIATMIDEKELRVESQVPEDKGLRDIAVGQQAYFNVSAFAGKRYYGTVDEVSPVSSDASLTFSISDKKAVKNFIVKIRFDESQYKELKPGMSAEVWIIK